MPCLVSNVRVVLLCCRRLPTTGRCRGKHELHQLQRGGLGRDADATPVEKEVTEEPHVLHPGADRSAGKRSECHTPFKHHSVNM